MSLVRDLPVVAFFHLVKELALCFMAFIYCFSVFCLTYSVTDLVCSYLLFRRDLSDTSLAGGQGRVPLLPDGQSPGPPPEEGLPPP